MDDAAAVLCAAWNEASESKHTMDTRQEKIASVLSLLTANVQHAWFGAFISDHVSASYPKQFRCLLDAVLQAFIATSPLHCGCVLQGFLQIPGHKTLGSPFRRDLAALFKPPAVLHGWCQQGIVVCSITSFLAADACRSLFALHTGPAAATPTQDDLASAAACSPTQQHPQKAERLGTTIVWLTDCLLQAVREQQLHLLQLVLATAVSECSKLEQLQLHQKVQQESTTVEPPPAKKPRLQEQQQQQQEHTQDGETAAGCNSTSHPSLQALHLGVQLLTALCCCEFVQRSTRQLIPAAAAAAASAAVGSTHVAVQAVQTGGWLYRQLCAQVKAGPVAHLAAAAVAPAAGGGGGGGGGASSGSGAASLLPAAALAHVLQHHMLAGPEPVLRLVHVAMGTQQPLAAVSATAMPSSSSSSGPGPMSTIQQWLPEAARQWRLPAAAEAAAGGGGRGSKRGKKGGRQGRQQQQHSGRGAAGQQSASAPPALPLQKVMPDDAANVNATWVSKHIVPVLVQKAAEEWQQSQQHMQQPQASGSLSSMPAAAALLQLLATNGLLLPAAGEVLVSARLLAEALNTLDPGMQQLVVAAWRRQLEQKHKTTASEAPSSATARAAPAAVAGAAAFVQHGGVGIIPWQVLQPMLCLLSHLQLTSPLACFLADCMRSCIAAASAQSATAAAARGGNVVRDVLSHILLPVRFGIKMEGRVWLLHQLLKQAPIWQPPCLGETAAGAGKPADVAAAVMQGLEQLLSKSCNKQLAQGLQLLAAERQQQQQDAAASASAGVLSLQQVQELDLATALLQLTDVLKVHAGDAGADASKWQQEATGRLSAVLQAADSAAYQMLVAAG